MQKTRLKIMEYLREHGEATVNELSEALGNLTAVTVRHHLDVLREEGLVGQPVPEHRSTPGRPRYVYGLTEKADAFFPGNVRNLADHMFVQVVETLPEQQVNVLFDGIAESMAAELPQEEGEPPEKRLDRVVEHLNTQGYEARWEATPEGFILHTTNCPYHDMATEHPEMCQLDVRYISEVLGAVPRRLNHLMEGDTSCSYLIKYN